MNTSTLVRKLWNYCNVLRDDGEGEKLYIGEGDPIRPRLESHYAQKDFRTRAVCFVAAPGQWNKAHVQFLEANPARQSRIRNVATASRQLACRP